MNVLSQGKVNLNDALPTALLARAVCCWQWYLSSEKLNVTCHLFPRNWADYHDCSVLESSS